MRGVIARMIRNKGFGFLRGEDNVERFFHSSSVRPWVDFDKLAEGDPITFDEDRSPKGPRAKNIDMDATRFTDRDQAKETVAAKPASHSPQPGATQRAIPVARREAETAIGAEAYRRRPRGGVRPR